MKKRKIVETVEESLVDNTSGEIFAKAKKIVYRVSQEPAYVKLYFNTIMYICDLQERHTSVLMAILKRMPYADNVCQQISLTKGIKSDIAKEIGKTESYVNHSICDLTKGKILIHNDSSKRSTCYQVNPHIFARGDWKDIQALQLHINFFPEGKSFWSEVQTKQEIKKLEQSLKNKKSENQQTTVEPLSAEAQESWQKMAKNILEKQIEKSEKETADLKQKLEQLEKGESLTTVLP